MGFARSSAEQALTRARNNMSAATEYLLAHPFPDVSQCQSRPTLYFEAGPAPGPERDCDDLLQAKPRRHLSAKIQAM
jgi:hypothetical protein